MDMNELVERVRKAPGANMWAKAQHVWVSIGKNPDELADVWDAIGLVTLLRLERQTVKKTGQTLPIPIGNTGTRKDPWEWRRPDVIKARLYLHKSSRTMAEVAGILKKIEPAYQNNEETIREVHGRLDPETWKAFCKWTGIKTLAA